MKKIILVLVVALLASSAVVSAAQRPVHTEQYTIAQGDTLWALANRFETTVMNLLNLNPNITPDNLRVGQQLKVPVEPLWSYHVVQKGDNVHSLAAQYQVPLDALIEANNIKNNRVTVGETIRIPIHFRIDDDKVDNEAEQTTEEPVIHVVDIGDTLFLIAREYKVSMSDLVEWNELENPNTIWAGQELIVG